MHHAALRDAGPVVWLEPIKCYAMARHADVQAALNDHETFCSARGVGLADFATEPPMRQPSLLLEADPPLHDRTRGGAALGPIVAGLLFSFDFGLPVVAIVMASGSLVAAATLFLLKPAKSEI